MLARDLPVLVEAVRHVGHHQTRNRGTIGGSIALGEPAAELPATAVALGATIKMRSVRGTRSVPANEFYLGPYMTALEPDELVTEISLPGWPRGHVVLFHEVARRPGDFALVGHGRCAVRRGRQDRSCRARLVRDGPDAYTGKVRRANASRPTARHNRLTGGCPTRPQ